MNNEAAFDALFGGYFHQDWVDDYATWQNTVDNFARENPASVDAALDAIEAVTHGGANVAEAALDRVGCAFDAAFFDKAYDEWLLEVAARLRARPEAATFGARRTAS